MELRQHLNEHQWRFGDLDQVSIVIRHRGAPGDRRTVRGSAILAIRKNGVLVASFEADDGEVFVPYSRFLEVRTPDRLEWSKSRGDVDDGVAAGEEDDHD